MPAADADLRDDSPPPTPPPLIQLPFPPVTREHILNCSVHSWLPRYRSSTPKTRVVRLSPAFLAYLRADGIILPPYSSPPGNAESSPDSDDDDDYDDGDQRDPSLDWPEVHAAVASAIKELGGRVHPKLNWSAPKDATWIAATNSMECASANDVYLLLKSSDFVTHDLEQAFDGCVGQDGGSALAESDIPYHLVLRKSVPSMVTSMEFRCFVRKRRIIGICQRDLNHYEFLPSLILQLQDLILDFFEEKLQATFPDDSFVFDVYIPQPDKGRVWLIDINPWAPRTDPLIFSWMELLTMPDPPQEEQSDTASMEDGTVRLSLQGGDAHASGDYPAQDPTGHADESLDADEELPHRPEFRVVKRDDPEAYSFNTPLYGAHKLPRDVVDASGSGGGGLRDFMARWEELKADAEAGRLSDGDSD